MDMTIVLWAFGGCFSIIGILLGLIYKDYISNRNKHEKLLEAILFSLNEQSKTIAAIQAGKVEYVTFNDYIVKNKDIEDKYDQKISDAKIEVLEEVEAVEERINYKHSELTTRVSDLEKKVYQKVQVHAI